MSMATMVMISSRRKRDDRGRYMEDDRMMDDRKGMAGNENRYNRRSEEADGRYWPEPHMPPYLRNDPMEARRMEGERMERGAYNMRDRNVVNIRDYQDRRQIGFAPKQTRRDWEDEGENPYGEEPEVYRQQREERRNEDQESRRMHTQEAGGGREENQQRRKRMEQEGEQRVRNMGKSQGMQEMDKQTAMEWVESMEDKIGVKGGAYTWHQTQQYGRNLGITGEQRLIEFFAVMNAMQSDYWPVAKKFGVDKPEFYAMMAKCFIEDADAVEDKVAKYYECIAKK